MASRINKTRYWWAVLWIENLISDWQSKIADLVQLPYAYCIHNSDVDTQSEHRKDHLHLLLCFPNTTTYKHALEVFRLLGENAVNTCEACVNVRRCYEYLIHNTESCQKAGKHLYDVSERVTGNGFDIGLFEQLSMVDRFEIRKQLKQLILQEQITNYADFTMRVDEFDSMEYSEVETSNSAYFERIIRGNYFKYYQPSE